MFQLKMKNFAQIYEFYIKAKYNFIIQATILKLGGLFGKIIESQLNISKIMPASPKKDCDMG